MTQPLPDGNRMYVSLFAGIEGFGIALDAAGWQCHTRCEIDDYCNRVTRGWLPFTCKSKRDVRRTSGTRFHGVGLVCGGFPCQDLSVAGKRKGLAGKRSGLFHELVRIVAEARPRWLLWENVPGLLSSDGDRDFWLVNAALAEVGYFGAWRVLDSQYFGVAQRRRRLFGLYAEGDSGARRAAAVLLEPESGGWNPAAGRGEGQGDRGAPEGGAGGAGGEGVSMALNCHKSGQVNDPSFATLLPTCFVQNTRDEVRLMNGNGNLAGALSAEPGMKQQNYVANTILTNPGSGWRMNCGQILAPRTGHSLKASGGFKQDDTHETYLPTDSGTVRRLTPTECERLQGFPVGWTIPRDKWTGWTLPKGLDSARYRALGNAVTTNVIYWIVLRINMVEDMLAASDGEVHP